MRNAIGLTAAALVLCLLALRAKTWLEATHHVHLPQAAILKAIQTTYQAKSLKLYNMGFSNLISGLMWVEFLQKGEMTRIDDNTTSWEYAQLDGITTLDPHFERAFNYGAIFLSVFRQDKQGARRLLEKWVAQQPISWRANYLLGYHLFYELKDKENAAKYLLRAATLEGAPAYLTSLGMRLLSESTGLVQSLQLAIELYEQMHDAEAKSRLLLRIRSINFAIQKSVWDEALTAYQHEKGHPPSQLEDLIPDAKAASRSLSSLASIGSVSPEIATALNEKFSFSYAPQSKSIQSKAAENLQRLGIYEQH